MKKKIILFSLFFLPLPFFVVLCIPTNIEIQIFPNVINLTHPRLKIGRVYMMSKETFTILPNTTLVWVTKFKIIDVVDPSGTKTYGEAETRQRILLLDINTQSSVLPFDFGFFEATNEDPLGGNRLHILLVSNIFFKFFI